MFRRIWHIVIKEFIQALRDPRLRLFVVLPPLIQLINYGYAINFDIKHISTAIFDEDRTPESRELVSRFEGSRYFQVALRAEGYPAVEAAIDDLLIVSSSAD